MLAHRSSSSLGLKVIGAVIAWTMIGFSFFGCTSLQKDKPAPLIPLRDFFKNPDIVDFSLSKDGQWLAYLKPWENRMNLFVRPTQGGEEKRLTSVKDRDLAGYVWKGNDHILYVRDFGGDENFHVYSVNIHTGVEKDLTPWNGVRATIVDVLEGISNDEILVAHNKRDRKIFDVFRINIQTGASKRIAKNNGRITSWLTDNAGKLRVGIETDGVNTKILYRDREDQAFKVLKSFNFKDTFDPALFTPDNKRIYAISNLGRDKAAAVEYDPATDKEIRVLYENPEYDTTAIAYSRQRKLVAAMVITWKGEYIYFDPKRKEIAEKVRAKLKNDSEIRFVSHDLAEKLFIIRTFSDRSPGVYYLYDVDKGNLIELANLGNHLPEDELAQVKPITYKSRDGLTIHGYLTLPKGRAAKKLPVVVNPHGGPWARNFWTYNSETQFLANRGYAVLQINFRGSTGYGRKFWEASFKQWGRTMQDDITDGVKWLIDQGIADPKRICIYGGSYGGYATLAGLAFTPDLYACGVDYVGVSNIFTLLQTIPPYWEPVREQFYEMIGHPEKDKELLKAVSPVFHADKIKAPLFIAQGAKDPRVKKSESDQMVEALKKRGIDVPYLVKENEGHGFYNEENRFEFYERMEEFLAKYLK